MSKFSFKSLMVIPHCGKDVRKYLYSMGVSAVVILTLTYVYEYHYLKVDKQGGMTNAMAVNQLTPVAGQFAGSGLGMNIAQPPAPPIRANDSIPGNHKSDGRDKVTCKNCHQINGQGRWTRPVAFMTPVNQDPRRVMVMANNQNQNQNPNQNNINREREINRNNVGMRAQNAREPFSHVVQSIRPSIVNINSIQTTGVANKVVDATAGGVQFADPASGRSMESLGSGIIVSQNGLVLTNYHVIKNATGINVTVFTDTGSQRYSADVVKTDEKLDLALVKIEPDLILSPAPLGDSDLVQVADSVIAIGSPFGLDQTVSRGIISGLRKSVVIGQVTHHRLIQTDAAINTGNSGGALIARDGTVIGVNTAIYTPTGAFSGIGFAVPMKQVKGFLVDVPDFNADNMDQGNRLGRNIAAVAAPPIRANSTPPGSHSDGRNQMACTTCHQVGNTRGMTPIAITDNIQSVPMGINVAGGQGGPRILAGTPSPHRDGREEMDCNICHQVIKPKNQANANVVGFMQPLQNGMSQFAPMPMAVAATINNQVYLDGAVLERITPIIAERINTQVNDGAFVTSVYPDTAASIAGLQAGDIIFKLNGRWVMSPEDLLQRISEYQVGDNLRLGVYTGGQRRNLYLVLSGQMQSPQQTNNASPVLQNGGANPLPNEMNWLGMELKPITPELTAKNINLQGKSGTLVSDVDRNSAAELAGLHKGDVVKRLNGLPINTVDELDKVINSTSIVQGILFLVDRNGRNIYITVKQ